MKKFISFILLFLFLISLTGCPPSDRNDQQDQGPTYLPLDGSCAEYPDALECGDRQTWRWNYNRYGYNGKGQKIKIYVDDVSLHDPFLESYQGTRQDEKQLQMIQIEDEYQIDIEYSEYPNVYWGKQRANWIKNYNASNYNEPAIFELDVFTLDKYDDPDFLLKLYNNDKEGILNDLKAAQSMHDQLYSYKVYEVYGYYEAIPKADQFLFYNQDIINEYNLQDPATLYNDRNWKYSDFYDYAKNTQLFLRGRISPDAYVFGGKIGHHLLGFTTSFGIDLSTYDYINFTSVNLRNIEVLMNNLIDRDMWNPDTFDEDFSESFINGMQLFTSGKLTDLDKLPEDFNVSVVPYPNDHRPEYVNYSFQYFSLPVDPSYAFVFLKNPKFEESVPGNVLVNIIDDLTRGIVPLYDPSEMSEHQYYLETLRKYINSEESIMAVSSISNAVYDDLVRYLNIYPILDRYMEDDFNFNDAIKRSFFDISYGFYNVSEKYQEKYLEVFNNNQIKNE